MVRKIEIVSLSRGILGEDFVRHEVELGKRRLEAYGVQVVFGRHALCGMDYIREHPETRAQDLLEAFADESVDMILCAVGGDDTYRLLPYLFENDELKKAVEGNRKIFLGFSDTTANHFMLRKAGLDTFYGQAFLPDVCELEDEMLPYSKNFFEELIQTGGIKKISPSGIWYEERKSFDQDQIGVRRVQHENRGFELLQGKARFSGKIFGGCIETIFDMFDCTRYGDSAELCKRYGLFPELDDWKGKILLLESSEEKSSPEHYKKMLCCLKEAGIFSVLSGVLVGKPADEVYFAEYKEILKEVVADESLPILCNISIGHAYPHCIIPFGVNANVDAEKQVITF